jgi:ABC-2 type transport system permease protein
MPIIITTILGFALQSMFSMGRVDEIDQIKFALVDEDQAAYSLDAFKKDLAASPMGAGMLNSEGMADLNKNYESLNPRNIFFKQFLGSKSVKQMVTYETMSRDEAMATLNAETYAGVVILPKSFSKDMTLNLLTPFRNEAMIELIPNGNMTMSSTILKALIGGFADQLNGVINEKNVTLEQQIQYGLALDFSNLTDLAKSDGNLSGELKSTTINGTNPIDSKGYYAIAMLAMFLMFVAAMGGSLILEEKDLYTYDRHLMAGYSPLKIMIAKMSVIAAVAVIQIVVMISYSKLIFGVEWGNWLNVFIISAVTVFGISGLGILLCVIGSVTKSYKIATIFQNGFIQVLALFGGSYLPVDQMPQLIQTVGQYLINGVILKAYLFNMMGYNLEQLTPYLMGIGINGVLFLTIAAGIFFVKEVGSDVAHTQTKVVDAA